MLKIGITGGIGSGKSIVCKIFSQLTVPVYNADGAAKHLMNSDINLISLLKKEFGSAIYDRKNKLNTQRFADIIYNDKNLLTKANSMIHPAVKQDFKNWLKNISGPYAIMEAAVLFESGINSILDYVITVTAPEKLRIQRVLLRDKTGEEQVKRIAKHQMPETEKKKRADFIIINDEKHLVIPQVIELHNRFLELSGNKK